MPPRLQDDRDGPTDSRIIARVRKLRREQSPVERELCWIVRDRRLGGYKFRRQFPIGKYSADFCCFDRKVVVEVDVIQHTDTYEQDLRREEFLRSAGFRVIRFWAREIHQDREGVLRRIVDFLEM